MKTIKKERDSFRRIVKSCDILLEIAVIFVFLCDSLDFLCEMLYNREAGCRTHICIQILMRKGEAYEI